MSDDSGVQIAGGKDTIEGSRRILDGKGEGLHLNNVTNL